MLDRVPSPDDVPWSAMSSYARKTKSLDALVSEWSADASSTGIAGPLCLRTPLQLRNWTAATKRPSVYQCLDLVALLDVRDGDAQAMAWFD